MKFASKRVNGWNQRHINMTKVAQALYTRIQNGYTLDTDEKQFLGDYQSLRLVYNKEVS